MAASGREGLSGARSWLLARDGGLRATRRAARTAIVMPALFAVGSQVIGNADVATFAAFGSFAMLLLADFGGTLGERLAAQSFLVAIGCVLIAPATLVSRTAWLAAVATLVVGFVVLFAGVVSSALAGASTSILLSFILPVTTPAPASAIPDRLLGWVLAGVVSLPAVTLLWPAPRKEPLREAASDACRQLAARLDAEVAARHAEPGEDADTAVARADAAVARLHATFLATPYRPSGLTTAARAVIRLVDEVVWLSVILDNAASVPRTVPADPTVREVKRAAGVLLDHAGKALSLNEPPQDSLQDHLDDLVRVRRAMEAVAVDGVELPREGEPMDGLVRALGPSFRAQELSFAVTAIAANIAVATAAEARSWWQKLLGRQPAGLPGPLTSAQERALAHVDVHSVWLRNSVRGALALAGAVLVADLSSAQHAFWIVLGALSVLRSNALSTGQSALRGVAGTTLGFVVGGALVLVIGKNQHLLWLLLPVAILIAGIAPAISFTAGQAGFTVTLLILFNIISPAGWEVGLVRVEDVAIGCAVSLVVGALFWPRGAAGALRQGLADAYAACTAYLRAAAESGTGLDDVAQSTDGAAVRAAAAARRLDDAFREYLAERGRKRLTMAEVGSLLTGVAGLRLTAEAVADLWTDHGAAAVDAPHAKLELITLTERVTNWFAAMAQALTGAGPVPRALQRSADADLVHALASDVRNGAHLDDHAVRTYAVRLVWTNDHVDVARRLQATVEPAARTASA